MKSSKRVIVGQVWVEMLLLLTALATLLTVPLPGVDARGRTAAVYLAESIWAYVQSLTFFVSLP